MGRGESRLAERTRRPRIFSGIQPTGKLHLGNYIGALSVWTEDQSKYEGIYCIVDLHALTIPENINPARLRTQSRELAALYIACGLNPNQSAIFVQSHVSAHAELAWILNCITPIGWAERMTQYKSKARSGSSVSLGLLDYPVLQAADVLLYQTNIVPIGGDQKQHVELAADIAHRFNRLFGDAFVIPQPHIRAVGARIMGLDDPTVKMSKSLGEIRKAHAIGLTDSPDEIREAIMGAVTDSGSEVRVDHSSPGIRNLLTIYQVLSGLSRAETETRFQGKSYQYLKREAADLIIVTLAPVRSRYVEIARDPAWLDGILQDGDERVRPVAETTLSRVKGLVGIGPLPSETASASKGV